MATLPKIAPDSTPKMSYRTARKFEMREVAFSEDKMEQIKHWLHEQIRARRQQLRKRHKNLVPEWRRIAEGRPKDEKKSWPFENCANLIHQVVGEASDDMAARVMGIVWATAPIILYRYFTKDQNPTETGRNQKKAKLLQEAMDYFAYEPCELDLWNKENIWFSDSSKLGTAWVLVRPEEIKEQVYIGYDEKNKGSNFEEATLYEGPRVMNLRDEDVLYDPDADTPEESDFFSRRCTLSRRQLQKREFDGWYKKGSVAKILSKPDRYGPDENRKKEQKHKGTGQGEEDLVLAEWDIEECYFYWFHSKKMFRLMAWYHYESKTLMNCVFNFVPDNQLPIVRTRLSSGEKGMNGRGLADMGRDAQEEISTAKNQRTDAITWGILGINRIDPQNKNIDKNFKVYPGASMPFGKDGFEHYEVGNAAMHGVSLQNEQAMIQQARERFGIGPSVAGQGAGAMTGKGKNAYYSAFGTFAAMQDQNTRVAHRTSDFRHSHVKLFGLLTDMYGAMGLGRKGSLFGLDDELLTEALNDYLERRVKIPIRAATASANREITKQNQMLFTNTFEMFVERMMKKLQAVGNAEVPGPIQKWLTAVIKGQVRLMQQMIRDFQLSDQPEEFCPDIELGEGQNDGKSQAGPAGVDPRIIEMANKLQRPGGIAVAGGPERMGEPAARPVGGAGGFGE